jgi:hypothetical protein
MHDYAKAVVNADSTVNGRTLRQRDEMSPQRLTARDSRAFLSAKRRSKMPGVCKMFRVRIAVAQDILRQGKGLISHNR